jgi:anti-sigma factor ChrR (cupin superfamily)
MNQTRLRADFSKREVVRPSDYEWVASPMPGVERMMLDRIGDEVARATTIVRYAPDSEFSSHTHGGGEEYLVLEGVFSDEHGDYPKGTYVRNPVGSSHTPRIGPEGATIFVKLHQFDEKDQVQKVINTNKASWQEVEEPGLQVMPLHSFGDEYVALLRYKPNAVFELHEHTGGEEILVLEGAFHDEYGSYPAGTWLRSPPSSSHKPVTGTEGAVLFIKTGHLQALI